MDFGKPGSSESSNDEYDGEEHDDPRKRPYECTFCKRGFTNAQALGGHMNIHRKDRAKAKQRLNSGSSLSNAHYNEQSYNGSKYFGPGSSQPGSAYFKPSAAPSYKPRLSVNEELLGVNLSLQIDQTSRVWKNEELDLELRLGHEYHR